MSTLLAIDTSTPQGSVAVLDPGSGAFLFSESFQAGRSHSAQLFVVLERALAELPGGRLGEIVVGLGPGSYAGVRIAISAAIGLALGRGARLTGIPSVAALAGPGEGETGYIAVGDARRESFYFAVVRGGELAEGPELVSAGELVARVAGAGNLALCTTELSPAFEAVRGLPLPKLRHPCARQLATLAAAGKSVIARDLLEPIYLREPHITAPRSVSSE